MEGLIVFQTSGFNNIDGFVRTSVSNTITSLTTFFKDWMVCCIETSSFLTMINAPRVFEENWANLDLESVTQVKDSDIFIFILVDLLY